MRPLPRGHAGGPHLPLQANPAGPPLGLGSRQAVATAATGNDDGEKRGNLDFESREEKGFLHPQKPFALFVVRSIYLGTTDPSEYKKSMAFFI